MIFYIGLGVIFLIYLGTVWSRYGEQKASWERKQRYVDGKEGWTASKFDVVDATAWPLVVTVFFTAILVAIFAFMTWIQVFAHGHQYKSGSENQNLAALQVSTTQETHGAVGGFATFVVGSIDSEGAKKINYMADVTGDGGYQALDMDASDAILYEGVASPHLTIQHYDAADYSHFWTPWDIVAEDVDVKNLFYVPQGSIQTKFDVDISK